MKNLMREIIFGRGAKASLLFVFGILMFVGLGCFGGKSSSSKTVPSEYFGDWKGSDGSTISIRGDGKGDYKSGGTTVDGGTVEIDDAKKELSITFFSIGPTLKIDSPPSGNEMKLGGVVYKKGGGSTTTTDTKKPVADTSPTTKESPVKNTFDKADAKKGVMPSDGEMQEIVKESLTDFNDAVKQGDFADFHDKISATWKKQVTPEQFNTAFSEFIQKKLDISEIRSMEADFSPAPSIDKSQGVSILKVVGQYDTSPNPTRFDMKYVPDGSDWKLLSIRVDTRK